MMMDADFGTAQSREKRLRSIRARASVAVRDLMVDALRQVPRVQRVPMAGLVGMNG
jgi:hypothetical protein